MNEIVVTEAPAVAARSALASAAPVAQPAAPDGPPECARQAGSWCQQVYQLTGNDWLAASADWLVAKPLNILLILVIAFVVRRLARRLIDHMTNNPDRKRTKRASAAVRRWAERAPVGLGSVNSERRQQRAQTIGSVLKSITSFVVYGLAFVLVLGELGVDLAPIIASAGVVGVALGFGAQNLVRDFLSGIFMMLEDQYGVGDWIDVGEATGTVEAIGLRVTTLRDLNGTVWYVRNGEIMRVGNSNQGFAVAVIDVPVSYKADLDRAIELLKSVAVDATADEQVAPQVLEPPDVLGVQDVTAQSATLRLTVKVRPGQQWAVQRALRARVMDALDEAGFEAPMAHFYSQ